MPDLCFSQKLRGAVTSLFLVRHALFGISAKIITKPLCCGEWNTLQCLCSVYLSASLYRCDTTGHITVYTLFVVVFGGVQSQSQIPLQIMIWAAEGLKRFKAKENRGMNCFFTSKSWEKSSLLSDQYRLSSPHEGRAEHRWYSRNTTLCWGLPAYPVSYIYVTSCVYSNEEISSSQFHVFVFKCVYLRSVIGQQLHWCTEQKLPRTVFCSHNTIILQFGNSCIAH